MNWIGGDWEGKLGGKDTKQVFSYRSVQLVSSERPKHALIDKTA